MVNRYRRPRFQLQPRRGDPYLGRWALPSAPVPDRDEDEARSTTKAQSGKKINVAFGRSPSRSTVRLCCNEL